MRHGRLFVAAAAALLAAAPAAHAEDTSRYALANGCYSLTPKLTGRPAAADIGPFRMKATDLGSYMLYGRRGDFLAKTGAGSVGSAAAPSDQADWTVDGTTGAFTVTLAAAKQQLAASSDGTLKLVDAGSAGDAGLFAFAPTSGCAIFPESDLGVSGAPSTAPSPYGDLPGLLDAHMHWMAFEFLGGKAHCGKPWDRYGVTVALVDCPDHSIPGSPGNVLEAALGGPPTHDTVGWPTFRYWPNYFSETHENTYYRWVERAWRAGLRIFVNLYVDNAALCKVYPLTPPDRKKCDEMDTVRLEMRRLHELQNYVDAQNGGPGKGWFRLVTTPFEARQAIAQGKLAIVQGIEISELFGCKLVNGASDCTSRQVDDRLEEVYKAGVRSMELVNKFDNAFVGVAGDNGTQGVIVNNGNRLEDGRYWDMKTCQGLPDGEADKTQITPAQASPALAQAIATFFPGGTVPAYPPGPHCNTVGLSSLGTHLLNAMMAKGMIVDPDHMSVLARGATLDLLEARQYGGVISSHSWSTPGAYRRIIRLGGVVTPIASGSKQFVRDWKAVRSYPRDPKYYSGFGWGADMNGFHAVGGPRAADGKNLVNYPFRSFDGRQTVSRLTTGQRTWDINKDGTANYGLFPDWVEDLRKVAGDRIVRDLGRGTEAYLEMWERAVGVPAYRPLQSRAIFRSTGLGKVALGASNEAVLRRVGQPQIRRPFAYRWGIQKRPIPRGAVWAGLRRNGSVGAILSTGRENPANGVHVGDAASSVGGARRAGAGLLAARGPKGVTWLFGVRAGRVTFTGVAATRSLAAARALVRTTGLL